MNDHNLTVAKLDNLIKFFEKKGYTASTACIKYGPDVEVNRDNCYVLRTDSLTQAREIKKMYSAGITFEKAGHETQRIHFIQSNINKYSSTDEMKTAIRLCLHLNAG